MSDINFRRKSAEAIKNMSDEEALAYREELIEYYRSLPTHKSPDKDKEESARLSREWRESTEKEYIKSARIYNRALQIFNAPIIINRELLPDNKRGIIFVSNHLGSLDQLPIIKALGEEPVHFLAKSTLQKMTLGEYISADEIELVKKLKQIAPGLIKGLLGYVVGDFYEKKGAIFVDENSLLSKGRGLETMKIIVAQHGSVFIFPEGTRNRTGKFMLHYDNGAAMVAQDTGGAIVPFGIEDCQNLKLRHPMIRIGEPIYVGPKDNLDYKTDEIRNSCARLVWANMEQRELERNKEYQDTIDGWVYDYQEMEDERPLNAMGNYKLSTATSDNDPKEAFKHLELVTASRSSSFLFNGNIKGY